MIPPALALGGGGSRALCHLGVLEVLAEEEIPVGALAGSSLGGLLAALYAFQPDAPAVRERAVRFFSTSPHFGGHRRPARDDGGLSCTGGAWSRLRKHLRTFFVFNMLSLRPSLLRTNPSMHAAAELLPDADIAEAALPLALNAIDLVHAEAVALTRGNVRAAVEAGTTVGIVFPPYRWNGGRYLDAAPVSSVPVHAARSLGARTVVAVDIRSPVEPAHGFHTGFDVVSRLEMTSSRLLNDREIASADVVIRPDVQEFFWGDFTAVEIIVERGRAAAREALPALRRVLDCPPVKDAAAPEQ
ncbi:MAG: patatin-like phospholipase family protein [Planctomycetota bacterium]